MPAISSSRLPGFPFLGLAGLALVFLSGPFFGSDANRDSNARAIPADRQVSAVNDTFDWVDGIVSGLADLAPAFSMREADPLGRRRAKRKAVSSPPQVTIAKETSMFSGRHLSLRKNTVFGIFDITVNETSPASFTMIVGSAEPAENVQVRDSGTGSILVDEPLDDEKVFTLSIGRALTPKIVVSVSVVQDGNINKAYFPLLGELDK